MHRRPIHLRRDDGESYCGLRLLDDARLTDVPARSGCALCRGTYEIDGHPTPRVSDLLTPVVDVPGAMAAQAELDRYLRDIREHDAAHNLSTEVQDTGIDNSGLRLPLGVKGSK
jgi:hypothetical protein